MVYFDGLHNIYRSLFHFWVSSPDTLCSLACFEEVSGYSHFAYSLRKVLDAESIIPFHVGSDWLVTNLDRLIKWLVIMGGWERGIFRFQFSDHYWVGIVACKCSNLLFCTYQHNLVEDAMLLLFLNHPCWNSTPREQWEISGCLLLWACCSRLCRGNIWATCQIKRKCVSRV